ncbi:hypothetical protein C1H46_031164 [Malus baccata]|uniref:Uncharacterized protein n=1 Tax=Malus baccata TaxID=106549 RepID=A0A540LA00_MALBA|nr:hypothetical protein C1H46_031164 [Malus baccata]
MFLGLVLLEISHITLFLEFPAKVAPQTLLETLKSAQTLVLFLLGLRPKPLPKILSLFPSEFVKTLGYKYVFSATISSTTLLPFKNTSQPQQFTILHHSPPPYILAVAPIQPKHIHDPSIHPRTSIDTCVAARWGRRRALGVSCLQIGAF